MSKELDALAARPPLQRGLIKLEHGEKAPASICPLPPGFREETDDEFRERLMTKRTFTHASVQRSPETIFGNPGDPQPFEIERPCPACKGSVPQPEMPPCDLCESTGKCTIATAAEYFGVDPAGLFRDLHPTLRTIRGDQRHVDGQPCPLCKGSGKALVAAAGKRASLESAAALVGDLRGQMLSIQGALDQAVRAMHRAAKT